MPFINKKRQVPVLGMNCNVPTEICFSFQGFRLRGGHTDEHKDGWGVAFFEGRGCRLILDAKSAAHSPVAELVRDYNPLIEHDRRHPQGHAGSVAVENTNPFMRELWDRYWMFRP